MATITTIAEWREAISYLTSIDYFGTITSTEIGETLNECFILDDETKTDITPDTSTLESALDSALLAATESQQIESAALVALGQGKTYLRNQLVKASPSINDVYTATKNAVDSNVYLAQMVSNVIAINSNVYVWTLNLATPTALDKQRYIKCVMEVIALLT